MTTCYRMHEIITSTHVNSCLILVFEKKKYEVLIKLETYRQQSRENDQLGTICSLICELFYACVNYRCSKKGAGI